MDIIKIVNLTKKYNNGTVAIDSLNLAIKKGEMVAIMGQSGSGKSTLLNILGCMDKQSFGDYYLEGNDIKVFNNNKISDIRNKKISFIFQHFALMKDYSVYDNIELPLTFRKMKKSNRRELIHLIAKELNIFDQLKKKPHQLSGGQQQRVAIARAIVSDSEIILADEPTGALDEKNGEELMDLLKEINIKGKTILIVTHNINVANKCHRIIEIKDGKLVIDRINEIK